MVIKPFSTPLLSVCLCCSFHLFFCFVFCKGIILQWHHFAMAMASFLSTFFKLPIFDFYAYDNTFHSL